MTKVIRVVDMVGDASITFDDGLLVKTEIVSGLDSREIVTVDFTGVVIHATPFFNAAFGSLLENHTICDIQKSVVIDGLDQDGLKLYKRVLDNAQKYYSDPNFRDSITAVLEKACNE